MITPLLKNALSPLVQRHQRLRALFASGASWFIAALAGAAVLLSHHGRGLAFLVAIAVFIGVRVFCRRWVGNWEPDYRAIARKIEDRHPELHALVRTAVEQQPDPQTKQLTYLQQRVVADAVTATRRYQWLDSIPTSRWVAGYATLWLGFAALIAALMLVKTTPRPPSARVVEQAPAKEAVTVTPGDTELERGSGLVVLAKFHHDVPSEAVLVLQPKNQPPQRLPLVKNLGDPVFGGGLPEVDADLSYRIEYAGQSTRDFAVKVFEHPKLERADATVDFPEYTKLPEKKIPDTHRVSAVEGSKLAVAFNLNKPVKSATLVAKDGTTIPLTVQADKPVAELRDFPLKKSQTYELRLVDADGRPNKLPSQFTLDALPNRRPELKIASPKGDSRVSPIEEVAFRAEAWDDFGMARYGLSYTIAGRETKDVDLGRETKADEKQQLSHLLKLEQLGVKPDELLSWYLWAEDVGPDGRSRRTETDMYFSEVRPFEEIFRQGDQQENGQQQGGGQGGAAQEIANSEKEIISATWNVKRSEEAAASPTPTAKYLKDEPVIRDSQAELLAKTAELSAKVEDPKSKALVENVVREMQTALDRLKEAEKTAEPLPRALTAEQSAYNALLKLAAHEYNVSRSQRSQNGKQANQRNQQQLDELELKEDKKRYETKSEADPKQNEQQREQLAVLNRLKELAQRQNDINERVKELQTALQEAKTEKEKEELRRQLKRLREEEQQMLTDIDELKQKMEQSSQQAQFAEERQKLEQTRGEAQKAAEAMEKNEATQALASGTRAQRELQQMRDDFRKKTSNQFRDEMREMRADARELAERQQEIAEKLKEQSGKPQRQTLDSSSEPEKLAGQFEKQQKQLGKVTEDMKRVSEQAEAAEPLLAKELYDTLRKTTQAATNETLEKTQLLAERGYKPQAQKFEEKARQEIDELKTGVERAAESVLGDEAEALRQARAELDELTRQLNREIARNRPDLAQADNDNPKGDRTGQNPENKQPGKDGQPREETAPQNGEGKKPGDPQQTGERGQTAQNGQRPESEQAGEKGEQPGQGRQPGQRGQTAQNGERPPSEPAGTQPGEKGEQSGQGRQPGQRGQQGQQKGAGQQNGAGQQAGQTAQNSQAQQPGERGENEPAQRDGREGGRDGQNANDREGSKDQAGNNRPGARLADLARDARERGGANDRGGRWGGPAEWNEQAGPLTGDRFVDWQDRLRNVEEMLDAPELRNEVSRVREIAKGVRAEFKRHSVAPNWDMVETKIRTPLAELRNRVTEELARRESRDNIVPIDRDPVPTKYAERVRRYYEDLGRSQR